MTGREIAIEFTEIWDDLDIDDINTMLAKNVSLELLEFFASYTKSAFGDVLPDTPEGLQATERLPNLMIIGYLIRLLEERLPQQS